MEDLVEPDWSRIVEVPGLVARLYEVVDELEAIFPGRHFTPDGHLVGSLGESLAAYAFDLRLNVASTTGHDARVGDQTVEVKATQRSAIAISPDDRCPDVLLVLRLSKERPPEVVYNGPAHRAWDLAGRPQKNGQRQISLSRLRQLDAELDESSRLPEIRRLSDIAWPDTEHD